MTPDADADICKQGLEDDLGKVLTVGVGRPTSKPTRHLEAVAARLPGPSLPPLRQVEDMVREAIQRLGTTGDFAIATALVFGIHEDAAGLTLQERRDKAADKLGVKLYTLTHYREKRMRGVLADDLLKRYAEAVAGDEAESGNGAVDDPPLAVRDRPLAGGSQTEVDLTAPTAHENEPKESAIESLPLDPAPVEQGEDEAGTGDKRTPTDERDQHERSDPPPAGDQVPPQPNSSAPTADDVESDELEDTVPSSTRSPRWRLMIGTTVLLIVGAVAVLLVARSGSGSARHRPRTAILAVPVTAASFSPNRSTYDYDVYDPNNANCADPNNPGAHFGRCGALTGHALDSFINTPSYGDERYFLDARLRNQSEDANTDPLTGVKVGSTVVLRAYADNDTATNPANPESSDTRDTRIRVNLANISVDELASREWVLQPQALISANNAQTVEDGVNIVGTEPFALQYEAGSAELLRNNNTYPLSNEIVGSQGAPIGLLYMNGDLPAGNDFDAAALIELRARVVAVAPPEIRIADQVRMRASKPTPWHSVIYAKPGDDVQWLLNTSNGPWSTVYHVIIRDVLPPDLEVIPGSVVFINAHGHESLAPGPLFGDGYYNDGYHPGANTLIIFTTKVLGNFKGCRVIDRNQGFARSDQTPIEVTNDADVVITKPGCSK
jgi:hypothetical protein